MPSRINWLPSQPALEHPFTPFAPQLFTAPPVPIFTTPLHARILATKNDIERITPAGHWDDAKKLTNPYEYIFLSLQRSMQRSISAYQPLSRSYFKMLELWDLIGFKPAASVAEGLPASHVAEGVALPAASVHVAEGPGGFLEAIQHRCSKIPMLAMTLRGTERQVPGWRKSHAFLQAHPYVKITYGSDGTGNLYNLANQDSFAADAPRNATLFTADGGFDFSADFNGQENTVQRLIVAEFLAGLQTLAPGPDSILIVKLFDTTQRATLEILWVVSTCFERTGLVKPFTSRPANSERYWIGRGFRGAPVWILTLLRSLTAQNAPTGWNQILAETVPVAWISALRTFQEELEYHQLNIIQLTLSILQHISTKHIRELLYENIRNSRRWCAAHGVAQNYVDLTDAQVVERNLAEAQVPFQALVARTYSREPFRLQRTHHGLFSHPPQPLPTERAWRSAIPASVRGIAPPSQTISDIPVSSLTCPEGSLFPVVSTPRVEAPEFHPPSV